MASDFVSSRSPNAFSTSWLLESARRSLCISALSLWYRESFGSTSPTAEISMVPGSDLDAAVAVAGAAAPPPVVGAAAGAEAGAVDATGGDGASGLALARSLA